MKAGYGRISTDNKTQDIETQKLATNNGCERMGIKIDEWFLDEGISGAKASRPGLDAMMAKIRAGEVDTVICYKLDRLGRSLKNLLDLLSELRNKQVRLISIMDGIDTANDNPMSRAFWQMLGVFAELEREMIVARVNDGLARARKEGKICGRPKGKKDANPRSKSGYYLRYAGKTKEERKLGGQNDE